MTFCLSPSLSSLVHYQLGLINRAITKCHVIISYLFLIPLIITYDVLRTILFAIFISLHMWWCVSRAKVISPNGLKTGSHLFDRREVIMPACDVQREIDMMSKSEISGVRFTLRYTLLWSSFLLRFQVKLKEWISVGDKQIRTFHLLPSLSRLDHYQPSSFSSPADNRLSGW